jgi:hypothetical protein
MLQVRGELDLGQEPFGSNDHREFGPEHLHGNPTVVLQVLGEIHRGHTALTQLSLDPVAVGEGGR